MRREREWGEVGVRKRGGEKEEEEGIRRRGYETNSRFV